MTKPYTRIHTKHKSKVRTNILISRDLLEKAKKLGLNISRITENALEAYINRLKDIQNEITKTSSFKPENSQAKGRERETVGVSWWTGRDLNPRPPDCKSGVRSRLNYRPFIFIDGMITVLFLRVLRIFLSLYGLFMAEV